MARIVIKSNPVPSIQPSDIQSGKVFTWGEGKYFYMKAGERHKVCLDDGHVSGFENGGIYSKLRVVDAEVHVYDQANP